MNIINCISCLKPKANLNCGICKEFVCKSCAQFIDENTFSFLQKIPAPLSHTVYCGNCFDDNVKSEIDSYNQTMEDAKNIAVFSKSQGKETRLFSRKEELFKIIDCKDHDEAILRLAFYAAQAHFNTIIDLDITFKKVKNGSYQYLLWSASARPSNSI
jgi:hypothetical protein